MEIQNKFLVEDKVKIIVSGGLGIITVLAVDDRDGKSVRYYVDYSSEKGEIKGKWFDDFEISLEKE